MLFFLGLIFFQAVLVIGQDFPTICLDQGACYKGAWINTIHGGESGAFASFQGIRYAKPPIESLRFKSPEPYIYEEGVYDVSQESRIQCTQLGGDYVTVMGQEDCLVMNVYTPKHPVFDEPNNSSLPVMIFIHGGGLIGGNNNYNQYGPQYFMEKKVVMVVINYRLGPFGFLSMGTSDVPGNAGFRDQTLAMTWVQENIANFGGNPNSVTLFGESAGALSVAMHLLTPKSNGLFHRAIMQSGTALAPSWGMITPNHAVTYADILAKRLNCVKGFSTDDVLECIQAKSDIQVAQLSIGIGNGTFLPPWNGVPDASFTHDPYFLEDAEILLSTGQFNTEIDVIVGTNKDEGILGILSVLQGQSWEDFAKSTNWPARLFNIANNSDITPIDVEKSNQALEFYIGDVENNVNEEHMQGIIDILTDADFLYGAYKTINYFLEQNMNVYQYQLTFRGKYSITSTFDVDPVGVSHGDDMIYMFDPFYGIDFEEIPLPQNDKMVRDIIVTAWTNFAKYGNPTPDPNSGLSWTPAWSILQHFWNISGTSPQMATNQDIQARMDLWKQIFE